MTYEKIMENTLKQAKERLDTVKEKREKLIVMEMPYKTREERKEKYSQEIYALEDLIGNLERMNRKQTRY